MGFTNFNGAKWVYAIGLSLLGHSDYESIGIPPDTYYKWNSFEGNVFPPDHELFTILKHGRIISAFMASIALGLLYILAFYITKNVFSQY
jgi:hypothetical protein